MAPSHVRQPMQSSHKKHTRQRVMHGTPSRSPGFLLSEAYVQNPKQKKSHENVAVPAHPSRYPRQMTCLTIVFRFTASYPSHRGVPRKGFELGRGLHRRVKDVLIRLSIQHRKGAAGRRAQGNRFPLSQRTCHKKRDTQIKKGLFRARKRPRKNERLQTINDKRRLENNTNGGRRRYFGVGHGTPIGQAGWVSAVYNRLT